MRWRHGAALLFVVLLFGSVTAANYVFERSVIKGVGYRDFEIIGQTEKGYSGQKFVERTYGSGSFDARTEFELDVVYDSVNYTQDAYFEYFPTSYQTGTYDQKWVDKTCVMNYDVGGVVTEAYSHAESLQKSTEIRTVGNGTNHSLGVQLSSRVIGVAHIGWVSRDAELRRSRHMELGRSVEDLTGVFSIEKLIELTNCSGNGTRVDWLPCL